MNSIRQTQQLNKRELESAVPPSASWHADYRDTAYIYIGGFPFDLSEGDILTIFSQYGNPTHLNLIRDRETGKSKGFAFLKYEDQRSCDLAVDNLGGAEVLGRMLRVDHTRYKKKDDEDEETYRVDRLEAVDDEADANGKQASDVVDSEGEKSKRRKKRPMIKEQRELEELMQKKEGEEDDPMKHYFIEEKKAEVERALAKIEKKDRHHHRHHRDKNRAQDKKHGSRRHRHRSRDDEKRHHKHRSKATDNDTLDMNTERTGDDRQAYRPRRRGSSTSRSRSSSRDQRRRGA